MFSLSETFFNFKMGFNWKKLFHPESFCQKLESIQYKAALSVAIQSTFRELGLKTLRSRRLLGCFACMLKFKISQTLQENTCAMVSFLSELQA